MRSGRSGNSRRPGYPIGRYYRSFTCKGGLRCSIVGALGDARRARPANLIPDEMPIQRRPQNVREEPEGQHRDKHLHPRNARVLRHLHFSLLSPLSRPFSPAAGSRPPSYSCAPLVYCTISTSILSPFPSLRPLLRCSTSRSSSDYGSASGWPGPTVITGPGERRILVRNFLERSCLERPSDLSNFKGPDQRGHEKKMLHSQRVFYKSGGQ